MVSDFTKPPELNGNDRKMSDFAFRVLGDLLKQVPSENRSRASQTSQWLSQQVVSRNYDHIAMMDAITRRGFSREFLIDFCIPMAARLLGDEWCRDLRSFAQVTLGSARLSQILKDTISDRPEICGPDSPAVVVAACHGEQHFLGIQVMADQLCRRGISVKLMLDVRPEELSNLLQTNDFSALLLTCSGQHASDAIQSAVNLARQAMGPAFPVFIGGHVTDDEKTVSKFKGATRITQNLDLVVSILEMARVSTKDKAETKG